MGIKAEQNALKQLMDLNCAVSTNCMHQYAIDEHSDGEGCETIAEFGEDGCCIRNAMRILKRSIGRQETK
jgi:hypothetical protein